eukprot:g2953.t1
METMEIPCAYCDKAFPRRDLRSHEKRCPMRGKGNNGTKGRAGPLDGQRGEPQSSSSSSSSSVTEGKREEEAKREEAKEEAKEWAGAGGIGGATGHLVPCAVCGRSFSGDRIAKHQSIRRKTGQGAKKRGVFKVERVEEGGGGGGFGGGFGPPPPRRS